MNGTRRLRYYHGGIAGLQPGDALTSPAERKCIPPLSFTRRRWDRVFFSERLWVAVTCAWQLGDAWVYEVCPLAPVEPDLSAAAYERSFCAPRAIVERVEMEDITQERWHSAREIYMCEFVDHGVAAVSMTPLQKRMEERKRTSPGLVSMFDMDEHELRDALRRAFEMAYPA